MLLIVGVVAIGVFDIDVVEASDAGIVEPSAACVVGDIRVVTVDSYLVLS